MRSKINSYLAILLITIAGAGASSIIVHIAYSDTVAARVGVVKIHHTSAPRNTSDYIGDTR